MNGFDLMDTVKDLKELSKKCFGKIDLINVSCNDCDKETIIKCYNTTFSEEIRIKLSEEVEILKGRVNHLEDKLDMILEGMK
jgi:hypothetical protein